MYFDLIPDIKYSVKPIGFPFSETDYVTAKNFFKRYTLNEKVFSYAVFFKKYTIKDSDRLDTIAERYYDNWPLDKESFDRKMDSLVINPFTTIHHYETEELKAGYKVDGIDVIALKGGLSVTQEFHDNPFTYYNGENQVTIPGNEVSRPISVYENEYRLNESRREIYILKKRYLNTFVNDFKKNNKYEVSSDFISSKLKRTSI
jgi:hypothetical protein